MYLLQAFDTEECMTWVDLGEASLLALDPGEVYIAGRYHSLVPILQEVSIFIVVCVERLNKKKPFKDDRNL